MESSSHEHTIRIGDEAAPTLSNTLLLSPLSLQTQMPAVKQVLPGTTQSSKRKQRVPKPSLWNTWEFRIYMLIYAVAVPSMLYTMLGASKPDRPEYKGYKHELSDGWLFGRKIDLSDSQWRMFRSHLPAFVLAMASFVGLNRVAGALVRRWQANNVSVGGGGAVAGLWFPFVFSCVFICVLSGTSVIFIAAIVTGNYWLSKTLGGRRWAPLVFWTYGIAVLFMNETYKGYAFKQLYSGLAWLDAYRGLLRRWDIMFNITMLRMLSFAMDYHWRVGQEQVAGARYVDGCALQECETEKQRVERSRLGGDYGFINYWAYLFYPPLYLTGPIITFNNFVAQKRQQTQTATLGALLYGVRLLVSWFLMEAMLHTVYSVAISKWGHWDTFSVYEISLMGYMRLTFIWLKLLIIWRFARFWAMLDGVETVENMRRCMSNNYSLQQFWRDWHCSYNRWLVRYLYVPLGGRRTSSWNTFVIFTFVALWHDLTLRLLEWAWLIALLFLPEALATWYFGQPKWSERWYFRYICSLGGAINIIAMMIANLVGFGDAGVNKMLEKIFSRQGATFLVVTYMALNVHLQVMFEWREHEYRREYYATASASEQNVELQAVSSDSTDENEAAGIPRHVVQQRPTAAKGSDALLDSSSESLDRRDHQD